MHPIAFLAGVIAGAVTSYNLDRILQNAKIVPKPVANSVPTVVNSIPTAVPETGDESKTGNNGAGDQLGDGDTPAIDASQD